MLIEHSKDTPPILPPDVAVVYTQLRANQVNIAVCCTHKEREGEGGNREEERQRESWKMEECAPRPPSLYVAANENFAFHFCCTVVECASHSCSIHGCTNHLAFTIQLRNRAKMEWSKTFHWSHIQIVKVLLGQKLVVIMGTLKPLVKKYEWAFHHSFPCASWWTTVIASRLHLNKT